MVAAKSSFVLPAVFASVLAVPMPAASDFTKHNGLEAIALNKKFSDLSPNSSCTNGQDGCVNKQFAQCSNGRFSLTYCPSDTICAALPLVNSPGTSIACTTEADKNARIATTGATEG